MLFLLDKLSDAIRTHLVMEDYFHGCNCPRCDRNRALAKAQSEVLAKRAEVLARRNKKVQGHSVLARAAASAAGEAQTSAKVVGEGSSPLAEMAVIVRRSAGWDLVHPDGITVKFHGMLFNALEECRKNGWLIKIATL